MRRPAGYRLVLIDASVTYLYVEFAVRVAAYPRFIVDGRSLTAEIGEGKQAPTLTLAAFWPTIVPHLTLLWFLLHGIKAQRVYHHCAKFNKPYLFMVPVSGIRARHR